jgi:hypothetical protein
MLGFPPSDFPFRIDGHNPRAPDADRADLFRVHVGIAAPSQTHPACRRCHQELLQCDATGSGPLSCFMRQEIVGGVLQALINR